MSLGSHGSGQLVVRPDVIFNGLKVFSATMFQQRDQLGEVVTAWIAANQNKQVTDIVVTQSSDAQFHMIAICVFFAEPH